MPVQIMTGSVQGPGSEYLLKINPDGSLNISGTVNAIVSGTIVIGSVSANVDSIYIQSGNNIHLGSAWTNIGSVTVSNFGEIGSLATQNIIGSVTLTTGSIATYGGGVGSTVISGGILGSVAITTNPLPISGALGNVAGSMAITTGSINIYGNMGITAGSITLFDRSGVSIYFDSNTMPNWRNVGSAVISGGILGSVAISTSPVPVSGAMGNLGGSFAITTSPIPISGTTQLFALSGTELHPLVSTGSRLLVAGSIQTYSPIGVGSVITSGISAITGSVTLYNYASWTGTGSVVISGTLSLSTTEASVGKSESAGTPGSATYIGGTFNGSLYPVKLDLGSYLIIAGSISSMPPVTATNPSVYAVSGIIANTGSVGLIGAHYNGSAWALRISNGSALMTDTIGSIAILTTPLPISGTSLLVSGAGTFEVSGTAFNTVWLGIGSVVNSQPTVYALSGILTNTGSGTLVGAHYNGSLWAMRLSNGSSLMVDIGNIGSVAISTTPIPVSGAMSNLAGSFAITTTPLPISGTSLLVSGAGVFTIAGSVRQTERPWQVEHYRDVFRISGVSFIGSFTGSNFITPGTGSVLLLKGFTASAEIATKFRLIFSGGTSTYLGTWNIPNSGTIAMNMLGMEPSGATNQPLAVGLFNTGSLFLTAFTRDTL